MQSKSLGGDRLGSGNKMKVDLHGYERSTHDLSRVWRSTMSAGTLVPFLNLVALPGDTFDINLDADIKTHPTIGPLFGSYKVQLDIFITPMRLYNSLLHNNMLGVGLDMAKIKIPQIELAVPAMDLSTISDIDNCQVNPSCILAYIGIRGLGLNTTEEEQYRSFNAIPLLAYWEIYKNYYSNKQEGIGAVIHTGSTAIVESITQIEVQNSTQTWLLEAAPGESAALNTDPVTTLTITYATTAPNLDTVILNIDGYGPQTLYNIFNGMWSDDGTDTIVGQWNYGRYGNAIIRNYEYSNATTPVETEPRVVTFDLDNIDTMRRNILKWDSDSVPFLINGNGAPYDYLVLYPATNIPNILASQEGLAVKTYQSDLFNNWLNDEYQDAISATSAVSTAGNSFTIDQLNLSKKVYELLNRVMVSGGTYEDWIDAVYGVNTTRSRETPMYMGGLIKELTFQEVVNNSGTDTQPLGTLAGKGVMSKKHKGGEIYVKVDEPSYIQGIISLTPRIDYSQGNSWDAQLKTFDDLHKPALDQIGFQDRTTEEMAWWDTEWVTDAWVQKSAGKQPAWLNYMTAVNETHGNFAISTNEMFMTLNRRYEFEEGTGIKDLTTYIDPSKFNFIFAEKALDAQNFWVQIAANITARRKMSAKVMPNL